MRSQKFWKFLVFSFEFNKFFSITKTIFSHSRSEQFWKQNTKYVHILLFLFSKVFYGKIYAPKCVRWENNEEGSNIIMMRPLHAHTAVLFRFFLSKYIIMDFGKDSSTDKTFHRDTFCSFLSGGFTTMAVINPRERKLERRTSVHCALWCQGLNIFLSNETMNCVERVKSKLPGKLGRYWAICWVAEELSWPV